jgi:alkaline phosphatase D
LDRRHFLQVSGLLSATALLPTNWAKAQSYVYSSLSIIQGPTNETTAQIAIDIPNKNSQIHYEVRDIQTQKYLVAQLLGSFSKGFASERVDHLRIEGLELGHSYLLQVLDSGNNILDEREFSGLDTNKPMAKLGLLSCMYDLLGTNIQAIWQQVQNANLDAILLLGDNCYGDIGGVVFSPQLLWSRYIATRKNLPFYHWRKLVPSFAIWDDHDFGKNNSDGNYIFKNDSLETFQAFYAQEDINGFFKQGLAASTTFELFGQKIVMLDGRMYRLLPSSVGTGFFGDQQLDWLNTEMNSTSKPLLLASGSQFFGGNIPKGETPEYQAPNEFALLNQNLAKLNRPILFASGDVHFSEVMKLERRNFNFDAYELTSSSMHSLLSSKLPSNNRRVAGAVGNNFTFVTFNQGRAELATNLGLRSTNFAFDIDL